EIKSKSRKSGLEMSGRNLASLVFIALILYQGSRIMEGWKDGRVEDWVRGDLALESGKEVCAAL
ncbi:MAG: hypothetical protein P8Y03_27605, partial [Anaerolineales bacterium]